MEPSHCGHEDDPSASVIADATAAINVSLDTSSYGDNEAEEEEGVDDQMEIFSSPRDKPRPSHSRIFSFDEDSEMLLDEDRFWAADDRDDPFHIQEVNYPLKQELKNRTINHGYMKDLSFDVDTETEDTEAADREADTEVDTADEDPQENPQEIPQENESEGEERKSGTESGFDFDFEYDCTRCEHVGVIMINGVSCPTCNCFRSNRLRAISQNCQSASRHNRRLRRHIYTTSTD